MSRLRRLVPVTIFLLFCGAVFLLGKNTLLVFFQPSVPLPKQPTRQDLFPGTGTRPTAEDFDPVEVVEQRPAITDVRPIAADRVTDEVDPEELVLGVVIDGQARGYPINVLMTPDREVFNDILSGQPIAATW